MTKAEITKDVNIIRARILLAIKNGGSTDEKVNASFMAQGQKDKDKPYVVHDTATLRAPSVRLILSSAAVNSFRVFHTK